MSNQCLDSEIIKIERSRLCIADYFRGELLQRNLRGEIGDVTNGLIEPPRCINVLT